MPTPPTAPKARMPMGPRKGLDAVWTPPCSPSERADRHRRELHAPRHIGRLTSGLREIWLLGIRWGVVKGRGVDRGATTVASYRFRRDSLPRSERDGLLAVEGA